MTVPFQLGPDVQVVRRAETIYGQLAANDAQARLVRLTAQDGLQATKSVIASEEIRRDLQTTRARHGMKAVAGSLSGELSLGAWDDLFEAVLRGTWSSVLSLSSLTVSIDQATGVCTRSAGSWLTDGIRRGDVVTFGGIGVNSGIRFMVVAVSATTFTIGNRSAIASSVSNASGATLTRPKKLVMPAAGSLVRRSFSIEQTLLTADESQMFTGCRAVGFSLTLTPGAPAGVSFAFLGQDAARRIGASSPYFTSPTTTTGIPMVGIDGAVADTAGALAAPTGATLSLDLQGTTQDVIGATITPDVFEGVGVVSAQASYIRQGFGRWQSFWTEGEAGLFLLLAVPGGSPQDFISFAIPQATLANVQAPVAQPSGPILESADLLVGVPTAADCDASMLTICTSAA
jgi:hypothetical protein